MKNLFTSYLLFGIITIGFGQEFPEKNKKYDFHIFEFIDKLTDKESISLETFLINTKPFSKWDIRPIKRETVWVIDTIYKSSEVPNFIWGAFANKYKLSQREAMKIPNQFLDKGVNEQTSLINYLNENLKKFDELSNHIMESKKEIFLYQNNLQRIDNLFKENDKYWQYDLPSDSPFSISNNIKIDIKDKFTKKQIKLLNVLKELKIYSAFKTQKGVFYLVDGFTDNSYGFYFNKKGEMEKDNFLFQIMKEKKINGNYYYYVAN
jgi:hypothetical protein